MEHLSISILTVCGVDELPAQQERSVTHVLSLLDPEWPEIAAFEDFGAHHRKTLYFHDIIEPVDGRILPTPEHMAEILRFGDDLAASSTERREGHLLVHCYMGVSRSTAAMLALLAQASPDDPEARLFERLRSIRPAAWPNSRMIAFADEQLGRGGRLSMELRRHYGFQLRANPAFRPWMEELGRSREVESAIL